MKRPQPATPDDVDQIVQQWVGIGTYLVLVRLDQMEKDIMATLADLVADDTQLEGEVAAIITELQNVEAQLAALQASGLTAEQQAQVDQVASSLTTLTSNIQAALPAPPTP